MQSPQPKTPDSPKHRLFELFLCACIFYTLMLIVSHSLFLPHNPKETSFDLPWKFPIEPVPHPEHRPWRIGYLESGPWIDYPQHLKRTVESLMVLGWIEPAEIPDFPPNQTEQFWIWLSSSVKSAYIDFVPSAYWSEQWDPQLRDHVRKTALASLAAEELDLILAMGTWAGQDLATPEHHIPTIVCSTSNPIKSGIIKSLSDPGLSHVHAAFDPDRYIRQITAFHNIFAFKTLGVVYEDSPEGRIFSSIDELEDIARKRRFTIIREFLSERDTPIEELPGKMRNAFERLAPQVDAVWIGAHLGEAPEHLPFVLQPLLQHHIPTWAQEGPRAVQNGALISVMGADFKRLGTFTARVVASVFHGIPPGQLPQQFNDPLALAINMKTAEMISYLPPETLQRSADMVFLGIPGIPGDAHFPATPSTP